MIKVINNTSNGLSFGALSLAGALALSAGNAGAASIGALFGNGGTAVSDESVEAIYSSLWPWSGTNVNGDSLLDVGDDLVGFAQWNTLDNAAGSNNIGPGQATNSTMATVFDSRVYWRGDLDATGALPPTVGGTGFDDPTATTPITRYDYVFESNPDFATYWEGELGLAAGDLSGAAILFFEDAAIPTTTTSISDGITALTSGTLLYALGFGADAGGANGWGTGNTGDERWISENSPEDTAGGLGFSSGTGLGNFNTAISVVYNAMPVAFDQIGADLTGLFGPTPTGDGLIDWNLSGQIRGSSDLDNKYTAGGTPGSYAPTDAAWALLSNNVNGTLDSTGVPEPSVVALFGAGLLGFGAAARSRRRKV